MRRHNFAANDAPIATRHVTPLRWLARLVCKLRSGKSGKAEVTGPSCRGPSLLHNLLPILEPFVLFEPKLLFLEDRILGREPTPRKNGSYEVPSSLDELKRWTKDAEQPCGCDECAPYLYQLSRNSSHGAIRTQDLTDARHRRQSRLQPWLVKPRPELRLRFYGEHEAMRLVRYHIDWLDNTYLIRPSTDNLNVERLKSLLQVWNPHLAGQDMRETMSQAQHLHLISLLNEVFFFGAIPAHRKAISEGFSYLPLTQQSCFGIGTFNPVIGTQLLLHPTLYRHHGDPSALDIRWRSRLGTIIHELSHAYLKAYTCRSCPMHDVCIGERGHGRAWQLLAAKLEEVATSLLGGFVDMGRYQSLLHDYQGHGRVPSAHDLEVLKFGTGWQGERDGSR